MIAADINSTAVARMLWRCGRTARARHRLWQSRFLGRQMSAGTGTPHGPEPCARSLQSIAGDREGTPDRPTTPPPVAGCADACRPAMAWARAGCGSGSGPGFRTYSVLFCSAWNRACTSGSCAGKVHRQQSHAGRGAVGPQVPARLLACELLDRGQRPGFQLLVAVACAFDHQDHRVHGDQNDIGERHAGHPVALVARGNGRECPHCCGQ